MEEQKKFIAPRSLIIANYTYSYKNNLANDYYSYRCKHRLKCKVCIKWEKNELIKYIENNKAHINYTITK